MSDVQPHDLDAERAVLGAIMVRNEAFTEVQDVLQPEDFFREAHTLVYRAMGELQQEKRPLDFVTIRMSLERHHCLDDVGLSYLSALTDGVPRSTRVGGYAQVVADCADRRRLQEVCRRGVSESVEAESAEAAATALVEHMRGAVRLRGDAGFSMATTLSDLMVQLDNPVPAITTGLPTLDALGCGFRPGEFTLLAGRPSHGKTALALHFAAAIARANVPVWLASLEMTRDALAMRWLSSSSGVSFGKLRDGSERLSPTEYASLSGALEKLSELPITIDDHASIGLGDLRRAMVGISGVLIVDYLQLIQPPRVRNQQRVHEVGAIARGLKAIAHDCKVSVLALSQLNRAVENRGGEPNMSDLRDSGELEQTCDICLLISRPSLADESELADRCVLKVAKHRNGPLGRLELVFDGGTQRFRERREDDPQPQAESSDESRMKHW